MTPEQALAHPNFAMGRVITTNSATLVNKGLEVIEAHLLFDIPFDRIDVVVHPQQQIHSMVEFHDGSTIAQLGPPRMLVPIALGLSWPERLEDVDVPCDWTRAQTWEFHPLDDDAFPAVRAGPAGRRGRRHLPGGLQRRQRGVRRRVPRRHDPLHRHRRHHRSGWSTPTPATRATRTASRGCSRRTPGPAPRPPGCSERGPRSRAWPCTWPERLVSGRRTVTMSTSPSSSVSSSWPPVSPRRSRCTRSVTSCRPSGSACG